MSRRKKILIVLPLVVLVIIGGYFYNNIYNEKNKSIDKVLEQEAYSYLSAEAKRYVRQVYEETGEIILTERNKKENVQYLNPEYVEYLTYSNEEKKKVSVVPKELIVDYVSDSKKVTLANHEDYYNMSEQDNNYITPMKNQGNLGICWAYATIENAETFLMKSNNNQYEDGVSKVLSPRQLDYVTSSFGIEDYVNKYGDHTLGTGSNFRTATKALTDGISFFESSWKYNNSNSLNKLELSEVFNDSLSKFELNSTIEMPVLNVKDLDLSKQSNLNKYNEYISKIKDLIKTYGGPYIGSEAPGSSCSAINIEDDTHHIIDTDSTCEKDGSHAMQIVGWDDNYNYKYCIDGSKHSKWTNECSSQNTVLGSGAWIVRNSWGDNTNDKFTYLTYNSIDTEYDFITSLESSENKKWNYIFNTTNSNMQISRDYNANTNSYNYILSFFPSFDVDSKIIKIKYRNTSQNSRYKIYISETGNDGDYTFVNDLTVEYPGYVTVDLSSKDYKLTKNTKIKIVCNDSLMDSFSVYTSEITDNKYIITKDKIYEQNNEFLENGLYKIRLFSNTYNIASGSEIEYQLFDQDGNDITPEMEVENNVVSSNMINTTLYLPNINNKSYYTVKTLYDGNVMSTSRLTIETPKPSKGSGTEEDPYVIMTPQDLYSINYNMDSHFVLGADIDLTYDTQNENGLYYNSGNGWTAIGYVKREAFSGSINGYYNGKIHKIIGMKTNSIGFIFYVDSDKKDVNIKNIIFEKAIVNNSNLLAYTIVGQNEGKVNIENIAAINSVFSNSSNFLSYNLKSYGKDSLNINSIFTDGTFNEGQATISSLAWGAETYENYTADASINISNIQIIGKINNNSSNFTTLLRFATGNIDVNNVIFNNYSIKTPYMFARLSQSSSGKKPNIKNIYYLNSASISYFSNPVFTEENVSQKTISDFKNVSSYNNWNDFNKYWTISNEDNVSRIPVLKFISFQYTTVNNINLNVGETVNIYDYISPSTEASHNMIIENLNGDKISLDSNGMITGLNYGTATIHILSNYDGFDNNITINVLDTTKSIIRFNSNNESEILAEQIVTNSQIESLNKNIFKKTGYKFKEWNTKPDGSGDSYVDQQEINLNNNLTLYAQWQPIKYQIKYHSNDSKNNTFIQDMEYDCRVTLNENKFIPEDVKYVFKEWNTKADGSGITYQDGESVYNIASKDGEVVNLYAQWQKVDLEISFDANGGIGTMDNINLKINENKNLPANTFIREGYIFKEWNTKADGKGISYSDRQIINLKNNLKLYAQWQPIKYQIKYHSNDNYDDIEKQVFSYGVEDNLIANPFTDNGLKFISWNTKPDGTGTSYDDEQSVKNLTAEENGVINLYAIWESYKISFDANGGNGKMNNVIYNVGGDDVQLPENLFTKPGYLFKNWNTKSNNSGTIYYHGDFVSVNEDMTLYAIWTPIKYNIYLYNTENEIVGAYLNRYYDKEYIMDNGQEQFALKQGYKFKEWNTKINGTGDSYKAGDTYKNLSSENNFSFNLYSILSPIIYKIKFDSNGGVGDMDDKVLTYDVGDSLSKNLFKNGNHRFKEWNTKSDGSGTSYKDGQDVKNLTDIDNDVITLYAIWEEDTGLKYDYNADGIIDLLDVKQLFRIYMITTDRENEEFVSKHDINGDGIVDLLDVKQFFRLVMLGTYD